MKRILMVAFVVSFLTVAGCFSWPRLSSPRAPKKSEKYQDWHEKTVTKPKAIVVGKDGKSVVVVSEETKTLDVTYQSKEEEAKLSWWQRMCRWFSGFGTIGIIAIIAGLIFFPGTTVTLLIRWARRSARAVREIVKAVKESQAVSDSDTALHDALKSNLSTTSKELVGKIKARL